MTTPFPQYPTKKYPLFENPQTSQGKWNDEEDYGYYFRKYQS
jgi:hypothetical protein